MNTIHKPGSRLILTALLLSVCALLLGSRAQAQGDGLTVTVVDVNDDGFPQVTIRFAVQHLDGLPATGLTAEDLQVTEDQTTIPTSSIVLDGDTTQPVGLVLAIDVSVQETTFPQMKAAAKAFLDALGEDDQVAVLTFADDVDIIQEFGSREDASKAIDGLAISGSYTVLNQATLQAVEKASEATLVRKAVVVITDSPSNLGSAIGDTVTQIEQTGVVVHLIGFGAKITPDRAEEMKTLARATKGQAFVLPTVLEIADPLHTLNVLLHQGYKLTYESQLQANSSRHTLSINVSHLDQEAEAETNFVAVPGQVTVRILGLEDGQRIGGIVQLTSQAEGPAAIQSIEYLVGSESLATVSEPPYRFAWDMTEIAPGPYVLTARAVDGVGNEGTAEIDLDIAAPVVVSMSADPTQIKSGEDISVEAEVTSIEDLAYVEFLVDGKPLIKDKEAPYAATVDGNTLRAGTPAVRGTSEHNITARAVDVLGRMDEAIVSVQIVPPPTPTPTPTPIPAPEYPLRQAWPIGAVAAIVLATGALTGLVLSSQRSHRRKVFQLELHNAGNIRDRYQLWTEALGALKRRAGISIRFALDGVPLTRCEIVETVEAAETVAVSASAPARGGRRAKERRGGGGVREKVGVFRQIASSIAGIFYSIASILPVSMRGPLQRVLGQYARGQARVTQVSAATGRVSSTVSRVAPKGAASPAVPAQAASTSAAAPGQITRTAQVTRTVTGSGYQTPLVEPDERLTVDAIIDPARQHYQSSDYLLKVFSRSMELDEAQSRAPMVIAQESIQIQGVGLVRRILPFLLIYGLALLSLFILQWILIAGL